MNLKINPKKTRDTLFLIIGTLFLLNWFSIIARIYFDSFGFPFITQLFDFNNEKNIPTLYSSTALIFSGILLFVISKIQKDKDEHSFLWSLLGIVFIFLAIDETASIHESLAEPFNSKFQTTGLLYYAWVIPYGIVLLFFIVGYLKFLFNLPKKIMKLFIISGSIFVMGAVGFEMISGAVAELHKGAGLLYAIFYTIEEFLEMSGIALFIYTLLTYISIKDEDFTVSIDKES